MRKVTPEKITRLSPGEVFVFGSNLAGRHGAGAALMAKKFGARSGCGRGATGRCYAIATKDSLLRPLHPIMIGFQVERFMAYALKRPDKTFLVTPIGCGLAGNHPREIAPFFKNAPPNVALPKSFIDLLENG